MDLQTLTPKSGSRSRQRQGEPTCKLLHRDVEWIYKIYHMAVKILVSLPQEFLDEIDRVAQEEHRSRSELIREALRSYLETRQVRKLRLKQVAEGRPIYGDFAAEFDAWDMASDEALTNFEKGLDKL